MSSTNWLVFAGLLAGLIAMLLVPAIMGQRSMRAEARNLLEGGELGEAEILGYEQDEYLRVKYTFVPLGAHAAIVCTKTIGPFEDRLPIGTKVPVRYKAKHPGISVLVPYAATQLPTS